MCRIVVASFWPWKIKWICADLSFIDTFVLFIWKSVYFHDSVPRFTLRLLLREWSRCLLVVKMSQSHSLNINTASDVWTTTSQPAASHQHTQGNAVCAVGNLSSSTLCTPKFDWMSLLVSCGLLLLLVFCKYHNFLQTCLSSLRICYVIQA